MDVNRRLRQHWQDAAEIKAKVATMTQKKVPSPYDDGRDTSSFEAFRDHPAHKKLTVRKRGAHSTYHVHVKGEKVVVPAVTTILRAAMPNFNPDTARNVVQCHRKEYKVKNGHHKALMVPKYRHDAPDGCVIAGVGAYGGSIVHTQMEHAFRHNHDVLSTLYGDAMVGMDPRTHALIRTLKVNLDLRVVAVEFPVHCSWGALRIDALAVDSKGTMWLIDYKTCGSIEYFIQHDGSAVHAPFSGLINRASAWSRSMFQVLMGEMMMRKTYGVTKVKSMVLAVSIRGVQPYYFSDKKWADLREDFYRDLEHMVPKMMLDYRSVQRSKRKRSECTSI